MLSWRVITSVKMTSKDYCKTQEGGTLVYWTRVKKSPSKKRVRECESIESASDVKSMTVAELRAFVKANNIKLPARGSGSNGAYIKADFVKVVRAFGRRSSSSRARVRASPLYSPSSRRSSRSSKK